MPALDYVNPRNIVELDVDGVGLPLSYEVDMTTGSYRAEELEAFAPKQNIGDFSYESLLPESAWARNNWSWGEGRSRFDAAFLGRCEKSKYADIRFRGQITKRLLDQAATLPQAVSCLPTVTFEGAWYTAGGRYVFSSTDGITWTQVNDRGAGTTATAIKVTSDYAAALGPILLIAYGDGTAYTYSLDGAAFTNSNRAADDAFATDFVTLQNRTWRLFSASDREVVHVSNTTDPTNTGAAWTGTVRLTNSDAPARSIRVFDNAIIVGKQDGLYVVQADGTFRHVADFSDFQDPANCRAMCTHGGYLWFNIGQRIFRFDGGTVVNASAVQSFMALGPDQADWQTGDVMGTPLTMLSAGGFLWVAVRTPTGQHLIRCYNDVAAEESGQKGAGWTTFQTSLTSVITGLGWIAPSGSNPRLIFSSGTTMRYILMPYDCLNPLEDQTANLRYSTADDDLYLDDFDALLPDVDKAWLSVDLDIRNYSATSVVIRYSIDGGAFAAFPAITVSGSTIRTRFPTNIQGRRLQLDIRLRTTDSAQTPVIRRIILRYENRSPRRMAWNLPLIIAEGQSAKQILQSSIQQRSSIYSARDRVYTVVFRDLLNAQHDVFVDRVISETIRPATSPTPGGAASYQLILFIRVKEYAGSQGAVYVDAENAIVDDPVYVA